MTELEALETAIEALGIECTRLASEARGWQRHGDDELFNQQESQNSTDIITRYEQAISTLQTMVVRMRQAAE